MSRRNVGVARTGVWCFDCTGLCDLCNGNISTIYGYCGSIFISFEGLHTNILWCLNRVLGFRDKALSLPQQNLISGSFLFYPASHCELCQHTVQPHPVQESISKNREAGQSACMWLYIYTCLNFPLFSMFLILQKNKAYKEIVWKKQVFLRWPPL